MICVAVFGGGCFNLYLFLFFFDVFRQLCFFVGKSDEDEDPFEKLKKKGTLDEVFFLRLGEVYTLAYQRVGVGDHPSFALMGCQIYQAGMKNFGNSNNFL